MRDLLVHLIKANAGLLIFYAGYYLVLRNLTFYSLNRFYLVFAILFATLYSFIDFASFVTRHEVLAENMQAVVVNWQSPVIGTAIVPGRIATSPISHHNLWFYIELVYWAGVALLFVRLIVRLMSLYNLRVQSKPAVVHSYKIRKTTENISPFSFWKSIYLNPDSYQENELKAILAHEQVHVDRWHTLDILLAELGTLFYWFNPGIWLIRKAVRENIEFLTDRQVLQMGYESKAYQYSLLQFNYGSNTSNSFVNHFNISTLKKRIIMMNAKASPKAKLIRYALLLPVMACMLLVFSVFKADLGGRGFLRESGRVNAGLLSTFGVNNSKRDTDIIQPARYADRIPEFPGGKVALNKFLSGNTGPTYRIVDRLPMYPGGQEAWHKYLISAVRYPKQAKEKKLQGKVITSFFVGKDGKLTDIKVLRDVGGGLGAEAVRVLAASPAWIPGSNEGKPLRMNFVMPIVFSLDGKVKRMPSQLQLDSARNPEGYKRMLSMIRNFNNFTIGGFGGADSARQRKPAEVIVLQSKMMGIEDPLYYLDGKQIDKDILKRRKANDIQSVSIYKQADAVSRYGEQAKNGVVVITSKKM